MRADQIRDFYDQCADRYDAKTAPLEWLWLKRLRQEAGGRLHGGTLEVAIGTGLNLPHYGIGVTHAVGIDLSSGMLLQAAMRSREVGRPIDLLQMDAERLAFADGSFDSLITTLSMCTVPRPEVALAEMMRVLRPGGRAVFLEHVRSPNRMVTAVLQSLSPLQERRHGCCLVRDSVETIRRAGFSIESDQSRILGVLRLVVCRKDAEPQRATIKGLSPARRTGPACAQI